MRQITLRGIPEDIENLVQNEAKSKGVSLNKAFLSLLRKGAGQQEAQHRGKRADGRSEFSKFLGLWSIAEADEFDASLLKERKIDAELWS